VRSADLGHVGLNARESVDEGCESVTLVVGSVMYVDESLTHVDDCGCDLDRRRPMVDESRWLFRTSG
jgi:hypothetical protein